MAAIAAARSLGGMVHRRTISSPDWNSTAGLTPLSPATAWICSGTLAWAATKPFQSSTVASSRTIGGRSMIAAVIAGQTASRITARFSSGSSSVGLGSVFESVWHWPRLRPKCIRTSCSGCLLASASAIAMATSSSACAIVTRLPGIESPGNLSAENAPRAALRRRAIDVYRRGSGAAAPRSCSAAAVSGLPIRLWAMVRWRSLTSSAASGSGSRATASAADAGARRRGDARDVAAERLVAHRGGEPGDPRHGRGRGKRRGGRRADLGLVEG